MKILLGQNTPSTKCDTGPLAAAIPDLAASKTTDASPVIAVNLADGFDATLDTWDGTHPNTAGEKIMANHWFAALQGVL